MKTANLTHCYDDDRPTVFREVLKLSRTREYYRAKLLEKEEAERYPYEPSPLPTYTPAPHQRPTLSLANIHAFTSNMIQSILP